MCGFLCEYVYHGTSITSTKAFEKLLAYSKHRGPDVTQCDFGANYQLGFNRLAILDVTDRGNQPMLSPTGRYHVLFNGEIYNFKDLASKYNIKDLVSNSDTEVLTCLLDVLGVETTLKVINGMFAIAIVDKQSNTLSLSRDFAGIKPLFYGVSKGGVVAASQFNQVFKHAFFQPDLALRKDVMKEYFGLGYMQAPNTIYKNIYQVNPGELVKISCEDVIEKKVLTEFNFFNEEGNEVKSDLEAREFNRIFSNVVKSQLVSDVPIASFLSGGIDSPLVSALASKHKPDIETFTIGVDSLRYDESENASNYAKHIGVNHIIEPIKKKDLLQNIDNHFKYVSEPFGDYSSIPTFLITKLARKRNTVMLSGDGGDELFFGYPRMVDVLKKKNWFKMPFVIRKPLVRFGVKLGLWRSWAPYNNKTLEDFVLSKHSHVSLESLNRLMPNSDFSEELKNLYRLPRNLTTKKMLHWLRKNEFYGHMQRVLIKVDRMSMANSLEVRVPFLDKDSISFACGYSPELHKTKFKLKELLKKVLLLHYPENLIKYDKKGFSVPLEDWLKNELKEDVKKVVFNRSFYGSPELNVSEIRNYVADFFEDKHQEFWGVWHIYAWQKWAISENLLVIE